MKIYVSEEEIKENDLCLENEDFLLMTGIKEKEYFEICGDVGEVRISLLEKHDKKIRNQVIDELLEWASYKINDYDTSIPRLEMINSFIKKLNDMKGEKQ